MEDSFLKPPFQKKIICLFEAGFRYIDFFYHVIGHGNNRERENQIRINKVGAVVIEK